MVRDPNPRQKIRRKRLLALLASRSIE